MIYDHTNCTPKCATYDVENLRILSHVISLNTTTGELVRAAMPLRVEHDEIVVEVERYEAIHPIFGGEPRPVLFHCYGRRP